MFNFGTMARVKYTVKRCQGGSSSSIQSSLFTQNVVRKRLILRLHIPSIASLDSVTKSWYTMLSSNTNKGMNGWFRVQNSKFPTFPTPPKPNNQTTKFLDYGILAFWNRPRAKLLDLGGCRELEIWASEPWINHLLLCWSLKTILRIKTEWKIQWRHWRSMSKKYHLFTNLLGK